MAWLWRWSIDRVRAVAVVAVLALLGISCGSSSTTPGNLPVATDAKVPVVTLFEEAAPEPVPAATSGLGESLIPVAPPGSEGPAAGLQLAPPLSGEEALVSEIVDGDTIRVILGSGVEERLRLIGVNTPEASECFAAEATAFLSSAIAGQVVTLVGDISDRDQFGRLLRYVWLGDRFINAELVQGGYAIARRYDPDTAYADFLAGFQATAQSTSIGMWAGDACGPAVDADIAILHVEFDAPGDDAANLNGEFVIIENLAAVSVDLSGWMLKDESASHRYEFPVGFAILGRGQTTVFSGCGSDSATSLYWCVSGWAIWNNAGDTAFLLDPRGNIVSTFAYGSSDALGGAVPLTAAVSTTASGLVDDGGTEAGNCDPSYPTVCIPPPPPDLDCGDILFRRFTVVGSDPHHFDGNNDGVGCES